MDNTTVVTALLFVSGFVVVYLGVMFIFRKQKTDMQYLARILGMTPVPQPDVALAEKIFALYPTVIGKAAYKLRHVAYRPLADGELFLFDLVDTGGDGDSTTANQAVAIRSSTLNLPPFQFYPKIDTQKHALSGLANKLVEWSASRVGKPVNLTQFPAFAARYTVVSQDPLAAQRFFDERIAHYFAQTQFYDLRAAGDLFVFTETEPGFEPSAQDRIRRRLDRALEIYQLFQSGVRQ